MKTNVILKTMVVILFTVILSVGNMFASLTPAQIVARQAQIQQDLLLLMPPTPPPPSPLVLKKIAARKAALSISPMDKNGRASPLTPGGSTPAPYYAVIDLGTLGGTSSYGEAINNNGQVVGSSTTSSGDRHAFLYSNGSMQDINPAGGGYSEAYGINNKGQVVGEILDDAFFYSNGSM